MRPGQNKEGEWSSGNKDICTLKCVYEDIFGEYRSGTPKTFGRQIKEQRHFGHNLIVSKCRN